jgi:hypothetical protein
MKFANRVPIVVAAQLMAVGAGAGCRLSTNSEGDLVAENFGDLSHPLEQRSDAFADIETACGVQAQPVGKESEMRRRPYLQKLGSHSAELLWTTDRAMQEPTVSITRPDGSLVERAAATVDASAHPPEGAIQWMSSLEGLAPDTIYCYEVQAAGVPLRRAGFRTAPLAGAGHTVRILAIGDTGDGSADQQAVLAQTRRVPFEVVVHMGDLAYSVGNRAEIERNFFRMYGELLETFALFPASGNHEYNTDDAAPFREAFALPENGGPEGRERWYSFDWGDVHFVALDTERVGAEQASWLDADLTANQRPWTVVFHHRPAFSSGEHGSTPNVQQFFVPLFEKHRVPLVLAGHDHDYERSVPINGVTYVVTGGGGVGTRPVGRSSFTAFSESVCHFVFITVAGDTLTLHAIDGVGTEFDSLVLTR